MATAQSETVRPGVREALADRVSLWRTPRTRALLVLGALGIAGGVVAVLARVYTDLIWFQELGVVRAYWTTLKWKILAHGIVGLGTTCFVLLNLTVVVRRTGGRPDRLVWRQWQLVYPVVAIAAGVICMQARPDDSWQLLLLWANRSDFGVDDPLFHRDVGYFVFSLPLYQQVARWWLETLAMASAATFGAYAAAGALRAARAHLLTLAALALAVVAWRVRHEQLSLVLPREPPQLPGASYTDEHVVLPVLSVLALAAPAGAILSLCAAVRRVPPLLVAALSLVAVAAIVARSELPPLVERFDVQPQELTRARPQLERTIAATVRAFALDRVDVRSLPANDRLSAEDIRANRRTLDNVPLWDSQVLRPALDDLQSIGRYYRFRSLTVDRYTVDGELRVMTVAARQLDRSRLGPEPPGWATQRFAYTHGYGVVAVAATGTDSERQPRFAQRPFDGGPNPLGLREPRIYYGEGQDRSPPYVIVNSRRGEIDAPAPGSQAPGYHYDGSGGIALSSWWRRAAFAARFGDLRLLLTGTVTDRSRIILHRDVRDRLLAVAPFLRWERRPQTAVIDGRVQFVFHGYTTTPNYPYSALVRMGGDRVSYARDAAVATVDAFSGRVSLYVADQEDPILRAWRAAYPDLFQPQMPAQLRERLRYPRLLFSAQVEAYETYHAGDATAFWNGTDAWQRPQQIAGPVEDVGEIHFPDPGRQLDADERRDDDVDPDDWKARPEYLFARLPGDASEQFMAVMPFTPRGGENLVGYLAGAVDERGRARLTLLSLPRDRLALGPSQATRRILAHPAVSRRLELLNRESRDLGDAAVNRTILGAPRIVPVAGSLVHVQPLYLTAAGNGVPRLQLVTVIANGRVGYGRTLRAALRRTL
jgi:uncharacterized protein